MKTKSSVYGWLNHEAKSWWAFQGDRVKQRKSIRSNVKRWREAVAEKAYVTIGHGNTVLHGGNWRVQGYGDFDTATPQIALRLGLPVIDLTSISHEKLSSLTFGGPMTVIDSHGEKAPWGPLSYCPISVMAAIYATVGVKMWNITPDFERAKPENFRNASQWESDAFTGFVTGDPVKLGNAMTASRS